MKIIIYLSISLVLFNYSCEKSQDCPKDFIVYGKIEPYAETYKLGDTITLSATFDHMIYDRYTEKNYDFSSVKIDCLFLIHKLDTTSGYYCKIYDYVDTVTNSKYNYNIEHYSDGASILYNNAILLNSSFTTTLQIILKTTGLFMISYGPYAIDCSQDFPEKCGNTNYYLSTRLNKGKDNNIYLLKESPDEHFNTWMIEDSERFYYQKSGFAYRVVN